MNLAAVEKLALELMEQHGLLANGWTLKFDNSKRRYGVCVQRRAGYKFKRVYVDGDFYKRELVTFEAVRYIGLSRPLCKLNNEESVRDTILHEIAHALAGCSAGHGPVWKNVAVSIGCNGEQCYDPSTTVTPEPKYIGVCSKGHESHKHRKTNKMFRTSCGKCAPVYKAENKYTWRDSSGRVLVDPYLAQEERIRAIRLEGMRAYEALRALDSATKAA